MPPVNTVKGPKYNSCPDSSPCAKNAVEIIENNNQFVWVEEKARWFSPDGKRQIWFEDGWKYKGDGGIIGEFTVVEKHSMCKTTYKTSTTGNGSFMNGHHGIQSDWMIGVNPVAPPLKAILPAALLLIDLLGRLRRHIVEGELFNSHHSFPPHSTSSGVVSLTACVRLYRNQPCNRLPS